MHRRILPIASFVVVFLAMAPVASAKGPAGATIEGDGVAGSVVIDQRGELGQGTAMSRLVEAIGFFDLTFGDSPRIGAKQPTRSLGDSGLTITWDMGDGSTIVQELYLDAAGGPVTHVAPGQEFWDEGWETVGGWFTITGDVVTPLIEVGVEESVVADPAHGAVTEQSQPVTEDAAVGTAVSRGTTATAGAGAPTSHDGPGDIVPPLAVATLLIGGSMGVTSWIRRRRLASQ